MRQKKLKLYFHHKRFFSVDNKKNLFGGGFKKILGEVYSFLYYCGLYVIKGSKSLAKAFVFTAYHTGSAIFAASSSGAKTFKKDLASTKRFLPKRLLALRGLGFSRGLVIFLIMSLTGAGAITALGLIGRALALKNTVVQTAAVGNAYLSSAKNELAKQDFTAAQDRFSRAYQTFSNGQQQLSNSDKVLNQLLGLIPQKQDADRLISAAGLVAQAGENFAQIGEQIKSLKFTSAGIISNGQPTKDIFTSVAQRLSLTQDEIAEAGKDTAQVNPKNLPGQYQDTFIQLQSQLGAVQQALANFSQMLALAKGLFLDDQNILVVLENNNELRAGGGFMGTYGLLNLKDGQINKLTVSSVYDLDGQLTAVIKPPHPLLNVTDKWFLRDSNWFADFPTSAKKISDFYEQEGGLTPDSVIALTPDLIVNLLKITGPIDLPNYGVTLTSDNFIEQIQAQTTQSNDLPTNSPKQILADLLPVLIQKVSALDSRALPGIITALQDSLSAKQIVVYSRDQNTEDLLSQFNWAGQVQNSDRDYLSVVSSNLGGTKTDLDVDQKIGLNTNVLPDGTITDELTITRTNKLPKLPQTNNLSYIRVFVPKGSKLISNIGFDLKTLDFPDGEKYKIDDDVYNWEKSQVTDVLTGTNIGEESGKTIFGNWLNVDGGETRTIKLVYELPFKLADVDRYSLLLQKQIGAEPGDFNWKLNFSGHQIDWKNFDANTDTNSLSLDASISTDNFYGLVLQKR